MTLSVDAAYSSKATDILLWHSARRCCVSRSYHLFSSGSKTTLWGDSHVLSTAETLIDPLSEADLGMGLRLLVLHVDMWVMVRLRILNIWTPITSESICSDVVSLLDLRPAEFSIGLCPLKLFVIIDTRLIHSLLNELLGCVHSLIHVGLNRSQAACFGVFLFD